MRNVYFDEKMNGTVHVALGGGFEYLGGTNTSAIHWDIVKDLRSGGHIELDGGRTGRALRGVARACGHGRILRRALAADAKRN
jgi:leucyl aminopeptidase (aminopeptidase T)